MATALIIGSSDGIGLALRPHGVAVTNLRLGFVDTKMAKSPVKPFQISADAAAQNASPHDNVVHR